MAGIATGDAHNVVLASDGTGLTHSALAGVTNLAMVSRRATPTSQTIQPATERGIGVSGNHRLVLAADGTVWACGCNGPGPLGDNTITRAN